MTAELGQAPDGPTPFVFATVGTDHHPFSRLVEAVDAWAARTGLPVFIQSGTSDPPKHCRHSSLVPYAEMQTMLSSAMGVVSHGGPATIVQIRAAGKLCGVTINPHTPPEVLRYVLHAGNGQSPLEFMQHFDKAAHVSTPVFMGKGYGHGY